MAQRISHAVRFSGMAGLLTGLVAMPAAAAPAVVRVDAGRSVGPIGDLYNVGYDGWGDITNKGMVRRFQELGVRFCRLDVNLAELCGERPGNYRWDYTTPRDRGMGFTDRVRQIRANGWKPLLAFSYHGGGGAIPKWFHGEGNDANGKAWVHYNADGTRAAEGYGDQLGQATRVARDTVAHLASLGLKGLHWETIYEMGVEMPLVEIHHAVASGIREADPAAVIVGPATWPGWSVEERFVKPYLAKYGPDLLDVVSVHWYASNDHDLWKLWAGEPEGWVLTMAHEKYLGAMMERTPLYGQWTRSLRALLDDRGRNAAGKEIGILFTEIDVNATSCYLRNPVNPDWPRYRADTDCWVNTNAWGGVWWSSVLCHIAATGSGTGAFKFTTRNYYGLQEGAEGDAAYRFPVWFALKLLREEGGLEAGRQILPASVSGEGVPAVEAYATGGPEGPRVILINKGSEARSARVALSGLPGGRWDATRYLFDRTRVAHFQGRKPGDKGDGTFAGAPADDRVSETCLRALETLPCTTAGGRVRLPEVSLPPVSVTVFRLARRG